MIMPCMKSTSACDRGGRVARVEDGRDLLGSPGAPGCTTAGFARSGRCAWAAGEKKTEKTLAASNARTTTPCAEPGLGSRSGRKRTCFQLGVRRKIPIWTRFRYCHETGNFSKRTTKGERRIWLALSRGTHRVRGMAYSRD